MRTAIQQARGDFCIVQDADLEYDPSEYPRLLRPLLDGHADAVFGSRYLAERTNPRVAVLAFHDQQVASRCLSNMFCNLNLTDMETCYKVFRTDLLKSIPIRSNRFGFEPEITMKCAKRKLRIYEVPISYHGRTYEEGKKIGWKDGVKALGVILHFWLIDDLYVGALRPRISQQAHGHAAVFELARPAIVRPYVGRHSAGAGRRHREHRVTSDGPQATVCRGGEGSAISACFAQSLSAHAQRSGAEALIPERAEDYQEAGGPFRYSSMRECSGIRWTILKWRYRAAVGVLKPGGSLMVLAPQGPALYGTLDKTLGQRRRIQPGRTARLYWKERFQVQEMRQINKIGTPGWWLFGKVLRRDHSTSPC